MSIMTQVLTISALFLQSPETNLVEFSTEMSPQPLRISADRDMSSLLDQGKHYMSQDYLKRFQDSSQSAIENQPTVLKNTGQSQIREIPNTVESTPGNCILIKQRIGPSP
jgi:hypothetical protein